MAELSTVNRVVVGSSPTLPVPANARPARALLVPVTNGPSHRVRAAAIRVRIGQASGAPIGSACERFRGLMRNGWWLRGGS